jgi:glyoxylate carboligase
VAQIASEALAQRLIDWGVDTVFGLPGDGINGIMEGLRRHQDRLRFVLVHHEEAAAFMATAHAKATGMTPSSPATAAPSPPGRHGTGRSAATASGQPRLVSTSGHGKMTGRSW